MQKLALSQVRAHQVAAGHIALWWLGQSGFIVKGPAGTILAIDPYLSDACAKIGEEAGINMNRQVPPPMEARDLAGVDAILLTHSHPDHCDPETLEPAVTGGFTGFLLAPAETTTKLASIGVPESQICMMWPNRETRAGEFTIRELAEQVIAQTGSRSRLEFRPLPQDDPQQRQPDITLARTKLGWEPKVPLADGLKRTIAWFKENIDRVR